MKKLTLVFTVLLIAGSVFGQSNLKPAIHSGKAAFTQDGKTSTTLFTLQATSAEIQDLKTHAATLSNIKFSAEKQKGDNYSCKLIITDRSESAYVQRIFGFFGFTKFTIDGQEKELMELNNTIAKLK